MNTLQSNIGVYSTYFGLYKVVNMYSVYCYSYPSMCVCVCVCVCVVCVCVCVHVCVHVGACMYVCMYLRDRVHACSPDNPYMIILLLHALLQVFNCLQQLFFLFFIPSSCCFSVMPFLFKVSFVKIKLQV